MGMGLVLGNQGKSQEEIEYYDKILAIDPNDVLALNNKGNDLHKQSKSKEAIEYYDKALAIDPKNESARYDRFLAVEHLTK